MKKKFLLALALLLFASPAFAWTTGQTSNWPFVGLTGGGAALDGISGASIEPNDIAVGTETTGTTTYAYGVSTGSEAESLPYIVTPDDIGGGVTRWKLQGISGDTIWGRSFIVDSRTITGTQYDNWQTAYDWGDHSGQGYSTESSVSAWLTDYTDASAFTGATGFYKSGDDPTFGTATLNKGIGGVSPFIVYSGATLTGDQLGGGLVYWDSGSAGTMGLTDISTGCTEFCVITDIQGSGVTIRGYNSESFLNESTWGTVIWVPEGNLGHQISLKSVSTGTSTFWHVIGYIGSNWTTE